jgi:Ca-activated chloride channel family protein
MSAFHFLRPYWLLALPLLFALAWRLNRREREIGDWRKVCDAALLPYILERGDGGQASKWASRPLILGAILAILALAGPAWERLPTPAFRDAAALVIALDISRIMDAADIEPSRLIRARYKIADLLRQRKGGLTALLVYSGDAFAVTPLTDDAATIESQLSALSSDLAPAQGSRADLALELAGKLLQQAGLTRGDVLLISNGVQLDKAAAAARALRERGGRLSVLGAGGEEGAPVPLPKGGFLQDSKGNIVISKLAAPALQRLAEAGGGLFRKLTPDNADVQALLGFFETGARAGEKETEAAGVQIERWEERGPWLLLAAIPLAALAFRRGILAILLALAAIPPQPAHALEWQDLWQTRDQRAAEAMNAGEAARAAALFENPAWKAAAQYRAGNYEEAAKTLQNLNAADSRYNLGNALAKLGRYPEAAAAYDQALKLAPGHEDARYNKELVEKALQAQKKQEQNQKQDQKDQKDGEQNPQNQDKGEGEGKPNEETSAQNRNENSPPPAGERAQNPENAEPSEKGEKQEQAGQERQPESLPDKQKENAEEQDAQARKAQAGESEGDQEDRQARTSAGEERRSEERQADEQWLRSIPDDPGGFLRRKFQHQYQQRRANRAPEEDNR